MASLREGRKERKSQGKGSTALVMQAGRRRSLGHHHALGKQEEGVGKKEKGQGKIGNNVEGQARPGTIVTQ